MISISLPKYPVIIARAYYSENSFPGLLEGRPSIKMIEERVMLAKKLAPTSSTGFLPVLLRKMQKSKHIFYNKEYDSNNFPTHYCVADFESMNATDDNFMMSYLTISWFMSFDDKMGYVESIQDALRDFQWGKYAINGDW
jgi:hypothetical protein